MRIRVGQSMDTFWQILAGTLFVFVLILLPTHQAEAFDAADGFNPDVNGTIQAVVVQPDGKILIGGNFTTVETVSRNRIARLNPDGSLDTTFDPGAGADSEVWFVALQDDGRILIGGYFTSVNGTTRNYIARLESNGTLDATFDPGTGPDGTLYDLVLQPDGKVLIGGVFANVNGTGRNNIARLNADGSVDTSFDPGAGPDADVAAIYVLNDGKILVGGGFANVGGTTRNYLARLNRNGTLDTSFDPGSALNNSVLDISVQVDGRILICGYFTTPYTRIARLESDGSVDTGFDPGAGANTDVAVVKVQPDGKILIGGSFTVVDGTGRNYIARLNSDGSLDTGFDPGTGANGAVNAIAIQSDNKALIGGTFSSVNGVGRTRIARFEQGGSLDTDFAPVNGPNTGVISMAVQPDGKILIGGFFTTVNGAARTYIARLNSDGSLDTTFNTTVDPYGLGYIYAIVVQPDGKILIGGNFTAINGTPRNRIARLNSDGSLDTSFDPGGGANDRVYTIALQPDGKVVIGGAFYYIDVNSCNYIARLNSDGSVDTGFDPGTGPNQVVYTLAVQPDGKVVIGGYFITVNGTSRNRIARLNSDGTLDTGFDPGTGATSNVVALALQADGKVVIGGVFTAVNGTGRVRIARLNSDGSLDTSFDPGTTGVNEEIRSLILLSDGKILIGGQFTDVNGTPVNYIARLLSDGSLDTTFDPGAGPNARVDALALQPDGRILLGGIFTQINGTTRYYLGRASLPEAAIQSLMVKSDGTTVTWLRSGVGPELNRTTLELSADGINWSLLAEGQRIAGGWEFTSLSLPRATLQYVRLRGYSAGGYFSGSGSLLEAVHQVYLADAKCSFYVIKAPNGKGVSFCL